MSELTFAKNFLTTLDSRPTKVQSDYAVDLRSLEPRIPYILPRMPKPMRRSTASSAPGSTPTLTVRLKSLRNPPLDIPLPSQASTTSVLELKQKVAQDLGLTGTDKVKLLYKKKPCSDSKTIKDVVGEGETEQEAEFSVMIIGGLPEKRMTNETAAAGEAPTASTVEQEKGDVPMEDAPTVQGESGTEVMQRDDFWQDLEDFLLQRVRDKGVAEKARRMFQQTWIEQGR